MNVNLGSDMPAETEFGGKNLNSRVAISSIFDSDFKLRWDWYAIPAYSNVGAVEFGNVQLVKGKSDDLSSRPLASTFGLLLQY